jgi:flagellar motor switch protein FliN/FliY
MKSSESSSRLSAHIETALAGALSSMTGKDFTVSRETKQDGDGLAEPIVWQQSFSTDPSAILWLVAGKELWAAAGKLTLEAVGIDSLTDEDCRSTWQEIVGQTIGGIASSLTADFQKEVTAAKGEELTVEPPETEWTIFSARHDQSDAWYLKVGWTPALTAQYDRAEPEQKFQPTGTSTFSKTFDLLLDVALPVSVSFGKTSLQIREVLKLNTGSIVELNRLVVEPVDVIVNDCIIARGEVVVVDGNYGVRVTHLASREDRLRTGMTETSARVAAGAGA